MNITADSSRLAVALVGYGQMGHEIERLAAERNVEIVARYNSKHPLGNEPEGDFDVAIEFTNPTTVLGTIERLLGWGKPIVVGTTGWLGSLAAVERLVAEYNGRLVYASNFSIGVNIFFKLVRESARLFNEQDMYDVAVHEIHHVRKADAPSGTARSVADILLQEVARKSTILTTPPEGRIEPDTLHVTSQRLGTTVGTHIVTYDSDADTVELTHCAKNRSGFALGALLAAHWIGNREPGLYRFEEMF
jgi:4-hydroxy-tetrahydrodipicolinate reductase